MISRYFERLTAIVRPKRVYPAVSTDAEGLWIGSERVVWNDVLGLHAYKRDIYVGDFLCLAILAADGRLFEINEKSPGWEGAGNAFEQFLSGSMPHVEWMLRLIAAKPDESVVIYTNK